MNTDSSGAGVPINDCWNRIGIRGDQSCALLQRYIHCRNCPVHAQAAADLLDRITVSPSWRQAELRDGAADGVGATRSETNGAANGAANGATNRATIGTTDSAAAVDGNAASATQEAFLIFRVAEEWFALSARYISQVANASSIHSLPRVRSKHVLGLTNVRGQLNVCVSLSRLLDLAEAAPQAMAASVSRFIVARDIDATAGRERRGDQTTVFPVDEVHGVERFARAAHRPVPATLAHAAAAHTRALINWKGRTLGVLDGASLFETLRRSLG